MISALLLVIVFMTGQAPQDATTGELKKIEDRLAASWKQGDCDAWGASLDPQWSVIHVTGAIMTKVQVMELCKAPESRFETFNMDENRRPVVWQCGGGDRPHAGDDAWCDAADGETSVHRCIRSPLRAVADRRLAGHTPPTLTGQRG